jgi:alpha-tubulin suppressor-like RCC1 family protein
MSRGSPAYGIECALLSGNALKCWGQNNAGQLGVGDTNSRSDDAIEVDAMLCRGDAARPHSHPSRRRRILHLRVVDGADVYCFGDNSLGQLGRGNTDDVGDEAGELTIPAHRSPSSNVGFGLNV